MDFLRSLTNGLQLNSIELRATLRQLHAKVDNAAELKLKVGLLADEAEKVCKLQRRLNSYSERLDTTKRALETKETDVKEKAHHFISLELEVEPARAAISRGERLMRDSIERVFTRYFSLKRTQASGYRDLINAVLADAQALWSASVATVPA